MWFKLENNFLPLMGVVWNLYSKSEKMNEARVRGRRINANLKKKEKYMYISHSILCFYPKKKMEKWIYLIDNQQEISKYMQHLPMGVRKVWRMNEIIDLEPLGILVVRVK